MIPITDQANKLFLEGTLALGEAERYGICIDVPYCEKEIHKITRRMESLEKRIVAEPEVQIWKKKYGRKFKLTKDNQLRWLLYDKLKHKPPVKKKDEDKKDKVDYAALSVLNLTFLNLLIQNKKLKKTKDVLLGFLREQVNGILHPFFPLNMVVSYRGSSDSPNFQNNPIRDPIQGKSIRQAIIPRKGHGLLEIDYKGIEVGTTTCYHLDPTMIEYICDSSKDMHRDMAMEIYMLSLDQLDIKGIIRYCAKNKFIFPEFYGDWFKSCAKSLWNAIQLMNLKTAQGVPLKQHLRSQGITSYKKFEKYIEKVEDHFWNVRFKQYTKWKKDWFAEYEKNGYFDTLTGFRCQGVMAKNKVINYPPQGSAFHILLWSLIQLTKQVNRRKWISRPIAQIHDSKIIDYAPKEFNKVIRTCKKIMSHDIKKYWPWIIVPLEVDMECSAVDESWHEKKKLTNYPCPCGSEWTQSIINKDKGPGHRCPLCKEEYIPF